MAKLPVGIQNGLTVVNQSFLQDCVNGLNIWKSLNPDFFYQSVVDALVAAINVQPNQWILVEKAPVYIQVMYNAREAYNTWEYELGGGLGNFPKVEDTRGMIDTIIDNYTAQSQYATPKQPVIF